MKVVAILLFAFFLGVLVVANSVFALKSPSAWMGYRWHGLSIRWSGIREKDLNSPYGRFKIIFYSLVGLIFGLGLLLFIGCILLMLSGIIS
jgi:hypothetical protein